MATTWSQLAQMFYDGAWNQVPDRVDAATGVSLERGVGDDQDIKPGTCEFRLLDDDDAFRPSNAASPIYDQTGPYMRGAYATGGSVRFTGEAQHMNPGQTDDHEESGGVTIRGSRWVDVRLSGPLGRVGQWRDILASPMRTQIGGYGTALAGYWALEDGRDAQQLGNVVAGGQAASIRDATPGDDDRPAGAAASVLLAAGSTLVFRYRPMSTTGGYQVVIIAKVASTDGTLRELFSWRTSTGLTYAWRVSNASYGLRVVDRDGSIILDDVVVHGSEGEPGQWITTRIKVSEAAGTVTVEPSWYAQAGTTFWGFTTTHAGPMGAPLIGAVTPDPVVVAGARLAHHFVIAGTGTNLESGAFVAAFKGYTDERAADRFARLCASRGLPYVVRGTASLSARMGPQPQATFQDQLKQLRATEGGLIFDRADNIGVVLATRDYLYDQAAAPVLELEWPGDVGRSLAETAAARDAHNLVIARNATGSTATAELTAGRAGTADPPAGSGRLDKTVDTNLFFDGDDAADAANWWLRFYTQAVPRFDRITVDADAHPELLAGCHAAEPGTFIRLTGRTPDPLLLLVLSTAQRSGLARNVFTFAVAPGAVYRVGVEDDAGSRADSGSTTLAEDLDTTETAVDVATVDPAEAWNTAGGFDLLIEGERMTLVSATTATLSAGTWNQTLTVVRSANGVVKTHASGAEVHLADPVHEG